LANPFNSINNGKTWFGGNTQPIPIGCESTDITVNPKNSSWMYAFSWSGGLSVSDDSGLEFHNVVPGSPSYLLPPTALLVDPYNESYVFLLMIKVYTMERSMGELGLYGQTRLCMQLL